jgi:hypothetical protein
MTETTFKELASEEITTALSSQDYDINDKESRSFVWKAIFAHAPVDQEMNLFLFLPNTP